MRPRYPQCQCSAHEAAAARPDDELVQQLADLACELGQINAGLIRRDPETESIVRGWVRRNMGKVPR